MSIAKQVEALENYLAESADIIMEQNATIEKLEMRLESAKTTYREQAREIARLMEIIESMQTPKQNKPEGVFLQDYLDSIGYGHYYTRITKGIICKHAKIVGKKKRSAKAEHKSFVYDRESLAQAFFALLDADMLSCVVIK